VSACFDMLDMRRAHEWTDAFSQWCADDPDLVYRGECLVHRAEILRLHGSWPVALEEAQLACDRLSGRPGLGLAFYQIAELHRLRGDFAKAEDAYRLASEAGGAPHPGFALLRLAQGRCDAAKAAVCRLADEIHNRRTRSVVLAACVEILLAAGDVPGARHAAQELSTVAGSIGTAFLHAISAQAIGSVLLAEGNARAALASLRTASTLWDDLQAPYEKARVGVLMGQACQVLGDADTGQLEIEAARKTFRQLGALPDLARVDQLLETSASPSGCGLTPRELEVLRLVASGKTNRAIALTLRISEKTVARHISNIFLKLDLPSRAAATAYAFQHHLV
jgi:DNA-binding CsgD family transcriptional regulator